MVKREALCPLGEDSWSGPVRGSDPAGPQSEANGFSGGQQAGPSSMEITALRSAGQQTHNARSQFKNGRFVGNDPRGRSFVTDCNF